MATLGFGKAAWFVSLWLCASGAVAFDLSYQPLVAEEFDKWLAEAAKPRGQQEVQKTVQDGLQSLADWRRGRMDFGVLCLKKAVELKDKGALPKIEAILENGRAGGVEDRVCDELLGPATHAWIVLKADGDPKKQAKLAMECFDEKHTPFLVPEVCERFLENETATIRPLLLSYATTVETQIDPKTANDVWRIAVLCWLFGRPDLKLTQDEREAIMKGPNMNARCALAKVEVLRDPDWVVKYIETGMRSANQDERRCFRSCIKYYREVPATFGRLIDLILTDAERIPIPNKDQEAVEERIRIFMALTGLGVSPKVCAFLRKELARLSALRFMDCRETSWGAIRDMCDYAEMGLRDQGKKVRE